ncbi:MAG: hypothetical protein L3J28_09530 [Candidatus Polarisedimenticolaceae bacterium]|nr:hypothetical protein [Candidatus Polarisedimenticolaceae bacterium]
MSIQRIFYVTPYEMIVYRLDGSAWYQDARFPGGPECLQALDEYLTDGKELLSCIYTDLIEEEYRNDTIPHLNPRDRKTLMARKLRQQFRATPFRASHAQGRVKRGQQKGTRRDDRVLFAALTNPDNLNFWLDNLAAHKVPLIGIYSLPMISRRLLKQLHLKSEHSLLITEQLGSLLRQSFFNGFDLKVSRLTPMNFHNHDEQIVTLLREVKKNQRYLNRMQLLPHDAQLSVYILTNGENIERLRQGCPDSANICYHFIAINYATEQLGLQGEMEAEQSQELFLHLLHERLSSINYARPIDQRYYRMRQLRKGMVLASLLFAIISTGVSLNNLHHVENLHADQGQLAGEVRQLEHDYQQALAALPDVSIEPVDMRSAVTAYAKLKKSRFTPRGLLTAFSKGLDSHPRIQLEGIEWQASDKPGGEQEETMDSMAADRLDSGMMDADMMSESQMVEEKGPVAFYQIATLKGRIEPVGVDYRANFKLVEAFIRSLRQTHFFVEVSSAKMPLDVDSSSDLSGGYLREKKSPKGTFEIRAVVRVAQDAV